MSGNPDWALPMNRAELIAYAVRMRTKLEELAAECSECNGTGVSIDTGQDCTTCDDIREALRDT